MTEYVLLHDNFLLTTRVFWLFVPFWRIIHLNEEIAPYLFLHIWTSAVLPFARVGIMLRFCCGFESIPLHIIVA